MDNSNATNSNATNSNREEPIARRLRTRASLAQEEEPSAPVPPTITSRPRAPAEIESIIFPAELSAFPEKTFIVKLPVRVPDHLKDFDADEWPYDPVSSTEVAPRSWTSHQRRYDNTGLTFHEAMVECFGMSSPHTASLYAMEQFLKTNFVCELLIFDGWIKTEDCQKIRSTYRSIDWIASQQEVARREASERLIWAGAASYDRERTQNAEGDAFREHLGSQNMLGQEYNDGKGATHGIEGFGTAGEQA